MLYFVRFFSSTSKSFNITAIPPSAEVATVLVKESTNISNDEYPQSSNELALSPTPDEMASGHTVKESTKIANNELFQSPKESALSTMNSLNAAEPSSSVELSNSMPPPLPPAQPEKTFKEVAIQVNTIEDFMPKFTVFDFITNDTKLNSWTGLPSFKLLDSIEDCLYTAFPDIITNSKLNSLSVR